MQGVAEVVPVSSSAQLTLLPWLLRWDAPEDRTSFAAALHAGSCLGLAMALHKDLRSLTPGTAARLALTAVPAAVAGAVAQDAVEQRLGGPGSTAALLAAAGIVLWACDRGPQVRSVGAREARWAALAQVLALAPGVSRSGATLSALRATGVRREEAVRFSMLMSLPITAGAAALTVARARSAPAALPVVVSGVTALATARVVSGGSRRVLSGAALYRLGVATVVAVRLRRESR